MRKTVRTGEEFAPHCTALVHLPPKLVEQGSRRQRGATGKDS